MFQTASFFLKVLVFLFFLGWIPAAAGVERMPLEPAHNWEGKTIDRILFDQSPFLTEHDLYQLMEMHPGDVYQARRSREAVKKLYETGRFKSVWLALAPAPAGENRLLLSVHWIENQILTAIRFSKNRFLSDEDLIKTMVVQPGHAFNREWFEKSLVNVRTYYRQQGYFQAKVSSKLIPFSRVGVQQGVEAVIEVDEGRRTRIRNIRFIGEKIFPDWRLVLKIYSNKGEFYLFDELMKDIEALKQFYEEEGYIRVVIGPTGVSYDEVTNEVDLSISIQPFDQVSVFFEGKTQYDTKRLKEVLLIKKERSADPGVLEGSVGQLIRFYLSEGYASAQVAYRVKALPEENRTEVYFTINSGPRMSVESIQFSGHYAFLNKTLLDQISLSESRFFNKTYYVEDAVEKDAAALTLFYREEGFSHAVVTPQVTFNETHTSARILFKVDEGVRTRIGSIEVEGNQALSESELKASLRIVPQTPYTPAKVRQGRQALLSRYAREGYLKADIEPKLSFSPDQTDVGVSYFSVEGEQTRFGRIILEGNDFTHDEVILRELRVKSGAPYDPGAILESQRHLYKTGIFSSVRFEPVHAETESSLQDGAGSSLRGGEIDSRLQDVKVIVGEKPRTVFDFGVGYGDRERLRGLVEVSLLNLWGRGQSITARAEQSRVEERYFLTYRKPWFFDESITARITASYLDLEEVAFDLKTFSVVLGVDKEFSSRLTGALLYQIERKQTSNVVPNAVQTKEDDEPFVIGSLNPSFIYDTRDDPFNPRAGSVTSLVFRNAAKILASEVQMVKLTLQRRSYHALSPKWVFAFSGRVGVAERFGETESIPIAERFFVGGRNTVRGYDQDELGVLGETFDEGKPTGGNAMLVLNEELRYVLPKSFGLVFFFDHGNVWRRYQDMQLSEVKSTVGLGIRYNTPIGPFRLDWGYKLDREGEESPAAFHFTLGHAF